MAKKNLASTVPVRDKPDPDATHHTKYPAEVRQDTSAQPGNHDTYDVLADEYADLLPFSGGDDSGELSGGRFQQQNAVAPSGAKLLPPHHVLVKCHLYDNPEKCRLWDKYQNLRVAEEEAAEFTNNSWLETAWLYNRVHQLETVLKDNGITLPPEEDWPFEGHSINP